MKTKICPKCKTEKSFDLFGKNKSKKDGISTYCKKCSKEIDNEREWKRKEQKKEWAKNNKEKFLKYNYEWKKNNKEYKLKQADRNREYRAKKLGFNTIEEYENYLLNKKLEAEKKRKEKEIIREEKRKQREIERQYRIDNAEKIKEERRIKTNQDRKAQRKIDKQYQIMDNLRARTRKILKIQSAKKTTNMAKLIGCSGKELSDRFLSMGYDSNTCHIDHIIPISLFDLTLSEHQHVACHYLNLQPLKIKDNLIKHDSLIDNWQDKIKEICNHLNIDHASIIEHVNQYK